MKRKSSSEPPKSETGYTVLARRYRPQLFSELVGQEPVAQALKSAIETNRVAHAYLFTGARGVGKTSAARILAKALNCERGPTATPCNTCEICRAIASGDDVDVLEIDGASNNKVDEVRELRSNAQFRPSRARFKIYIIDEVHMLSTSAFNALLKTLEEPPPHVKFIFATTEVQKIPITILSRCQRFDFAGIGTPRIVARLKEVVANERMKADEEALTLIARRAGGSMRDAQSLLDQLLAFGGERLTVEQVHHLLGTANDERVAALVGAVLQCDPQGVLKLLAETADAGLQLGEFVDQLIEYWRDLMVANVAGAEASLSVVGKDRDKLHEQARGLTLDTILAGLDILVSCKTRLCNSSHGRILLEMSLVRLARLESLVALTQLAQSLAQPTDGSPSPARQPAPVAAAPPGTMSISASQPAPEVKKKPSNGLGEETAKPVELSAETLPEIWQGVKARIGGFLASDLGRGDLPAISGPNTLVLRFPTRYNLERDRCQAPAQLSRIEEVLRQVTGQAWQLRVEAGADVPATPMVTESDTAVRVRRDKAEALAIPLLKRAADLMGAQVLHLDDGFGRVPSPTGGAEQADAEEL